MGKPRVCGDDGVAWCSNGHPQTAENTYVDPGKPDWVRCRQCQRDRQRKRRERVRAELVEAVVEVPELDDEIDDDVGVEGYHRAFAWQPEPWTAEAACAGSEVNFFPERGESWTAAGKAKAVCARCPVRTDCLDYALRLGIRHGIFGGTSEDERRAIRRQLRAKASFGGVIKWQERDGWRLGRLGIGHGFATFSG